MSYYNEIENYIKKNEVSKKVRILEENRSTLENYWNIGRLVVEAQGGKERAKYGNMDSLKNGVFNIQSDMVKDMTPLI